MPQSTPERRKKWVDDQKAMNFLRYWGYTLRDDWTWKAPDRRPTTVELDAVQFLVEEYDFGGIE